jgi:hypothetical protein
MHKALLPLTPRETRSNSGSLLRVNEARSERLPAEAGSRRARHKAAGEITLAQMLHEWAMHDIGHIRQIAELVRRSLYSLTGCRSANNQRRPNWRMNDHSDSSSPPSHLLSCS